VEYKQLKILPPFWFSMNAVCNAIKCMHVVWIPLLPWNTQTIIKFKTYLEGHLLSTIWAGKAKSMTVYSSLMIYHNRGVEPSVTDGKTSRAK
jgi:hypothetical protein